MSKRGSSAVSTCHSLSCMVIYFCSVSFKSHAIPSFSDLLQASQFADQVRCSRDPSAALRPALSWNILHHVIWSPANCRFPWYSPPNILTSCLSIQSNPYIQIALSLAATHQAFWPSGPVILVSGLYYLRFLLHSRGISLVSFILQAQFASLP